MLNKLIDKTCTRCKETKTVDNFIFNICKECRKKTQKEWYQKNKKILYEKNKQRRLIYGKDKIKQWNDKWLSKNKEKYKEIARKSSIRWYYKNRKFIINRIGEYNKKQAKNMTDKYIKFLIRKRSHDLKSTDIPFELIQAYRLNLTLKRLIREK